MAYLYSEHEKILKELLEKEIAATVNPERLQVLKGTLAAVEMDYFEASTENNILSVADDFEELQEEGAGLTDDELSFLVHRMMKYDDGDYNDHVEYLIRQVLDEREENE